MLKSPLAPYLYWAKTRPTPRIDLAGSNLLACTLDDLPGTRDAVDLTAADRNGYPPLLEAIAAHYGVATDHVALASGCSAANFLVIGALVGPGDDVLMESPWYDQITGACELVGASVRHFARRFEDGYSIDISTVRAALTPRTRIIIVTTPHNPSGAILTRSSLESLQAVAEEIDGYVLVDEVYLDAANLMLARASSDTTARVAGPGAARAAGTHAPAALLGDRLLSVSSLTKSYGLAGLRCGWVIGAPEAVARIRRVRDVIDNIGAAPADRLSALAFGQIDALAHRATTLLSANLELARAFFAAQPRLETTVPLAATVTFPRIRGVADTQPFVTQLFDTTGVAVASGHFFGAPDHFRISLAGRTADLREGLACLGRALEQV